jgi:hypothetical protein
MSAGRRRVLALLAAAGLLALAQQQLLLRRPPRLLELRSSTTSSGPAALDLRFSRPMLRASLASRSDLQPPHPHQWLGDGNPLRLLLTAGHPLTGPIRLRIAGLDRRGQALAPQHWSWDPRPRLLAVVPAVGGEQLQMQRRDGSWQTLTPTLPRIGAVTALGDGSGVVLVSIEPQGQRVWRLSLRQSALERRPGAEPRLTSLQPLLAEPQLYAHLSSNRRGDLLVQASSTDLGRGRTQVWLRDGELRDLPIEASGPIQLLPEGGAVVVPELEGLRLHTLAPGGRSQPQRRPMLPGSRDLSSFCPLSGRALLLRHWPDYRRSLELVEPGLPPRQLWLGSDGVLGSACSRGGERVWLLLSTWQGALRLRLLELNRDGRVLRQQRLDGWAAEPGAPMLYDPTRMALLLTLRAAGRPEAQPVLIETAGADLQLRPIARPARRALWLPAG